MDGFRVACTDALKARSRRKNKNDCPKVQRLKAGAKLLGRTRWRDIEADPEALARFRQAVTSDVRGAVPASQSRPRILARISSAMARALNAASDSLSSAKQIAKLPF
jgi:hypothetical protein